LKGTYRESNYCNNCIHSTIFYLSNRINGMLQTYWKEKLRRRHCYKTQII
jgi:hypothetical protein